MSYYCYLIICDNKTYIGVTNNLKNRIRKHNGLIKGGAKSTRSKRSDHEWVYHTIIGEFENKSQVMKFEWYWKHKKNKKEKWQRTQPGLFNKMKRLIQLLLSEEWKNKKISTNN